MASLFELGRGHKYVKEEKQHQQFVLSIDFSNKYKPFVLSHFIENKIQFKKHIDSKEINSTCWERFLWDCNCLDLVRKFNSSPRDSIKRWRRRYKSTSKFHGQWVSQYITPALQIHALGNWTEMGDIPGKHYINIDLSSNINSIEIYIPVYNTYGPKSYHKEFSGRFQLTYKYILIWQNELIPRLMKYAWTSRFFGSDELVLFDRAKFNKNKKPITQSMMESFLQSDSTYS